MSTFRTFPQYVPRMFNENKTPAGFNIYKKNVYFILRNLKDSWNKKIFFNHVIIGIISYPLVHPEDYSYLLHIFHY